MGVRQCKVVPVLASFEIVLFPVFAGTRKRKEATRHVGATHGPQ